MAGVYDIGCAFYSAVPTAPPWWASEEGHTDQKVRRIMVNGGFREDLLHPAHAGWPGRKHLMAI